MHRILLILLLCCSTATTVAAQPLTLNSSFDSGTTNWEPLFATVLSHTTQDGFRAAGAAELSGILDEWTFIGQCLDFSGIEANPEVLIQMAVKPINYNQGFIAFNLGYVDCGSCPGDEFPSGSTLLGLADPGVWTSFAKEDSLEGTATDCVSFLAQVRMIDASPPAMTLTLLDDVSVSIPVFADGFESGTTADWSSQTR